VVHAASLLLALVLLGVAPPARAQADAEPVSVPQDLFAVITLRGKPCGKVTSYQKTGENDYLVTCETGHRYRVYVSADQRVVVEEK
jgi:hypothetical protein